MAKCDAEIGFSEADAAEGNDVGLIFDELQAKQVLNLHAIDFCGSGRVERVKNLGGSKFQIHQAAVAQYQDQKAQLAPRVADVQRAILTPIDLGAIRAI